MFSLSSYTSTQAVYNSLHGCTQNEWTDARRTVLRPWIRSAEVRGGGWGGGGGGGGWRRYENGNTTATIHKTCRSKIFRVGRTLDESNVPGKILACSQYILRVRFNLMCCCVGVALLFYVHGKHLRSCRDGQLT